MILNKKLLLADDDSDDRLLFSEIVDDLGKGEYTIESVENGLEVLSFLETIHDDNQLPGLIILDQNMPKMNGKETLRQLKSLDRFKKIPVIIYSTYHGNGFIQECDELGAILTTSKPNSYEGFKQMVKEFLEMP